MLRIIVRRGRVLAHIESGEAAGAIAEARIVRVGKALDVEQRHLFGMMLPVQLDVELLEEHAVAGDLDLGGLRRGELAQVAFPSLGVHGLDAVGGADGV
ncbi:hypothetical protein D3C80_1474320 [compost metagenome]